MNSYFYEYDPINNILRLRVEGVLTRDVLLDAHKDPKRRAVLDPCGAIFDLSAVTSVQVGATFISELAQLPPYVNDPIPRFIVAPSDVAFGLSRMFQTLGDTTRETLYVVRTIEEAYSRLGITEGHFKPIELPEQD